MQMVQQRNEVNESQDLLRLEGYSEVFQFLRSGSEQKYSGQPLINVILLRHICMNLTSSFLEMEMYHWTQKKTGVITFIIHHSNLTRFTFLYAESYSPLLGVACRETKDKNQHSRNTHAGTSWNKLYRHHGALKTSRLLYYTNDAIAVIIYHFSTCMWLWAGCHSCWDAGCHHLYPRTLW